MMRQNLVVAFRRSESYIFEDDDTAKSFEERPELDFIFHPENADDENLSYNIKAAVNLTELSPSFLNVYRDKNIIFIEAEYQLAIEVDRSCGKEEFNQWADESGGWSTAYFEPIIDWEPNDDFNDGFTSFCAVEEA